MKLNMLSTIKSVKEAYRYLTLKNYKSGQKIYKKYRFMPIERYIIVNKLGLNNDNKKNN